MPKARIKELRDQNSATLAQARSLLDQVTNDTPAERAAELESQHDAAMSEYRKREAQIERLEELEAAESRANGQRDADNRARRPAPGEPGPGDDGELPSYRDVFKKALQYGVSELNPQERSVFAAQGRALSPEERALATGSGATGGYLIPQDMMPTIDQAMAVWGPMMDGEDVARHITTATGNIITAPTLDYTAKTGELHTEGGDSTDDGTSDPAFGQKTLGAYIYKSGIVRVSLELLQDSAWDMESLMTELFGESLGRTCNAVLTTGDGSNKPEGIITAAGTSTGASASAITGDNLIDLVHSIDPAYRTSPKCLFQMNDTTLAYVRKLKDGNGNYLWQEANIRSGEPATLLGYRYRVNQALDDLGASKKPIVFGDHNKYIVRKVGAAGMIAFREKFMNELEVGFMAYRRIDGAGLNNKAIKALTMAAS